MRWLLLPALAGCLQSGSPPATSGSAALPSASETWLSPDPWAGPFNPTPAPAKKAELEEWTLSTTTIPMLEPVGHGAVTSIQGRSITALAAAEDGSVVATTDTRSVRLWPSLDGKHEPVVVAMRPTLSLAVGRDQDAIVIAGLDAIGQLELVRTNSDGAVVSRVAVESSRAVRQIFMIGQGVLALRDDDTIALYDHAGALRGELAPSARQRVRSLAVRHDRAIALLAAEGSVRVQWLELPSGRPAWGATTGALPFAAEQIALSSDGSKLAASDARGSIFVLDAASNRVIRKQLMTDDDGPLHVVGFVGATPVAENPDRGTLVDVFDELGQDVWIDQFLPFVTTDDMVIGATGTSLEIARRNKKPTFLGYRMSGALTVMPTSDGFLATEGTVLVQLGPDFRARKTVQLGPKQGPLDNPLFVDATHVVTRFQSGYENPDDVALVDLKRGSVTPLTTGWVMLHREAGLLAAQTATTLEIRRFDRKKGRFGEPLTTYLSSGTSLVWVDRKDADFALVSGDVDNMEATVALFKVRSTLEVVKTRTVKPDPSWFENPDAELLVDERSRVRMRRTSPDRAWVAELRRDGRMTLQDAAGHEQWMVSAAGAHDIAWTPGGELVAFGDGIAHVDLATGALRERQCGWQFGLWSEEPETTPAATLCEAP